jgi:membrane protease YdiL (CAAX protease family)
MPSPAAGRVAPVAPLLAAFAGAVAIRVAVAGDAGARSVGGSLLFAGALTAVAVLGGLRVPALSGRVLAIGGVAAAVLVVPALLRVGVHGSLPVADFPAWALLTVAVAGAEEAFLRGVVYDAVRRRHGVDAAILVAAALFALLHLPFYGVHALPLDFAVGIALGVTRLVAGSWAAPAVAHVGADLAGWWVL